MKAILYGNIGLRTFNVLEVEVLHPYLSILFTEKILKRTDNQDYKENQHERLHISVSRSERFWIVYYIFYLFIFETKHLLSLTRYLYIIH